VHTYLAGMTHAVIPNKLDVSLAYSYVTANNSQPLIFANGTGPNPATGGQFPDVSSTYQRLEAMAKYTFDDDFVRSMGWNGKVSARLRYAWENNRVTNWQTDVMQTYMYSVTNVAGYLAGGMTSWREDQLRVARIPRMTVPELHERWEDGPPLQVLDVRELSEWQQGHIPGYEAWTDNSDPVGAFASCGDDEDACTVIGCPGTAIGWQRNARSERWMQDS
jgi:hypothetical protein